jgi:serine/threonine-protein kinase
LQRLSELTRLAESEGHGDRWPWITDIPVRETVGYIPGWCNGTAGMVMLFTTAHEVLREPRLLERATRAARHVWDVASGTRDLCCGAAGCAYALLSTYRATGESVWLRRAQQLAHDAAGRSVDHFANGDSRLAHSLFRGPLGSAVLAADLERPEEARFPLLERAG